MENLRSTNIDQFQKDAEVSQSKTLLSSAFGWMFFALGISATLAYLFGTNLSLAAPLFNETGKGLSVLGWIVMFAPIGFVLAMSFGWQKLGFIPLLVLFALYSAVNGISLSFIFHAYSMGSLVKVFVASSALFGFMAIVGATTRTDLSKMGSMLMMALFGMVIASLINFFTHSSTMDYIISFVGVIVFTGLTAYDVQKIKNMDSEYSGETRAKLGLMGALSLYLDFINLFLMLLRLFGKRN